MKIYCITNLINNKKYIGQTTSSLKKRWSEHRATKTNKQIIHKAIRKYGEENFFIELLKECSSLEDLNSFEVKLIAEHETLNPKGYNLSHGGNGVGKHSEETKNKIRDAHLGKPKPLLSEEHKEKIRSSSLGRMHSEKTKLKLSSLKNKFKVSIVDQNDVRYESISDCSRSLLLQTSNIYKVLKGTIKQTGGYTFTYFQEKEHEQN